jgi:hypothetical protein
MLQAPSEHIKVAALIEKAFWLYLVGLMPSGCTFTHCYAQ